MSLARPRRTHNVLRFTFRLCQEDREAIDQRAKFLGTSPSVLMRAIARHAVELPVFPGREVAASLYGIAEELRRIGVNLNQLSRAINEGRYVPNQDIVDSLSEGIDLIYDTRHHMGNFLRQPKMEPPI